MSTIIDDLPPGRLPAKHNPPKVKIEFTDQKGAKYFFAVQGPSKENMSKLLEFVESISETQTDIQPEAEQIADTNFSKVYGLVQNKFRFGSFTSSDMLEAYEQHFQLKSTLSTMSTYLARLAERRVLTRSRNGSGWIYRLARQVKPQEDTLSMEATTAPTAAAFIER